MRGLPMTLQQVAEVVGGTVEGDAAVEIDRLAALDEAGPRDLTFADARHAADLPASGAAAAIVERGRPPGAAVPLVRVASVPEAVWRLLSHLAGPEDHPPAGVHPSAVVAADAAIGRGAAIGPGVVVGAGASIGDRCVLCARSFVGRGASLGEGTILAEGAVVRHGCRLGRRVRIGSNSVIGADGFGYYFDAGEHHKVPHVGAVVIEDDVEIGACACVDRAKFGSTLIGAGAKIDDLVMVAHNCRVGPGSILTGQVGLAGSVTLGRYVVIAGHAGLADNITVGDGAVIGAYSAVPRDVPAGERVLGVPAYPAPLARRVWIALGRLPELLNRVRELESRLEALESPTDH